MGNVLHFCPCPQILHTYCKFSRENFQNICDQYCKLWKYLWQILRTLSSFTSLLTELHYNHLHWPCLQISAISLSQISGAAQAIRDCLSDRNSLSDNKQSFLTENLCSAKFSFGHSSNTPQNDIWKMHQLLLGSNVLTIFIYNFLY